MGAIATAGLVLTVIVAGGTETLPEAVRGPAGGASSVPTAAFASDGVLWVAWVDGAHVYVGSSADLGKTFSPPVRVNAEAESIDANGEARPKIALGPHDEVYVSYTRKGTRPFTGDIRFSRRLPDGRFAAPVTVNDDGLATGHRFDTLSVSPKGDVHLAWIDKRDLEGAAEKKEPYVGAALYRAVSTDGGRTFTPNRKIKDGICECCRLALAWDGETPVLLWRDILEGSVRDHAIARLEERAEPTTRRATDDGWKIDGCPHHGPALAVGEGGTWHLAWFTGDGQRGVGTFYRRSVDRGRTFSEPIRLGSARAGRAAILAAGQSVWLAWKDVGSGATVVRASRSLDAGLTWSDPHEVSRTDGASDHPFLLDRGSERFLSWFTATEGYRVIPIE